MAGGVRARLAGWVLVGSAVFGGSACGDGDEPRACNLAPSADKAPAAGTLTYTVNASLLSDVLRIVYAGPNGRETITEAELPFSVSFEVERGASMYIRVLGVAPPGGTVAAGYSFTHADQAAAPILISETCQH
jgi:hypothetical protein